MVGISGEALDRTVAKFCGDDSSKVVTKPYIPGYTFECRCLLE